MSKKKLVLARRGESLGRRLGGPGAGSELGLVTACSQRDGNMGSLRESRGYEGSDGRDVAHQVCKGEAFEFI